MEKTFTMKIDAELYEQLSERSFKDRISKAELVRGALRGHLND